MAAVLRIPAWEQYGWLRHGFSTRQGGVSVVYGDQSLNLGWTKDDDPEAVTVNRRLLVEAVGETAGSLVTLRQVHGVKIQIVREDRGRCEDQRGRAIMDGDGLATDVSGVLLGIQTADCVPVMLADVARRAVAVLHAGWRGTAAGMVQQGVATMRREFGSVPGDLVAAVGPSIGQCCYKVGDEVREAFAPFAYWGKLFVNDRLDLWEANRRQLVDAGVGERRITVVGDCTGCTKTATGERKYFSHRVEQGAAGRMMSVIGVAST